jgi:hypothetical protein
MYVVCSLRCKRRRNVIEWEIELPVRRMGKWEVHELTPIPFKWKNGLCEWKAKEEFLIYKGEEAFVVPRATIGCIKQKACMIIKIDKLNPDLRCVRNQIDCMIDCRQEGQYLTRIEPSGQIFLASKADKIVIDCENFTNTILNHKNGAYKIKLPCDCNIRNVDINIEFLQCDISLRYSHVIPWYDVDEKPAKSSAGVGALSQME